MTRVLFVRHGETPWNREGRVQGWAATGLTDRGREQATALGEWLDRTHDVDRVISSDLQRTRATTTGIREAADGVPEPEFDAALRERGFGVYQGFLADELFDRFPDYDRTDSILTMPVDPVNGESLGTFIDRIERGWAELTETVDGGGTSLVVTHGGVLKSLRATLTDREVETVLSDPSPPNCSVTEVHLDGGAPELVEYGATPWRE